MVSSTQRIGENCYLQTVTINDDDDDDDDNDDDDDTFVDGKVDCDGVVGLCLRRVVYNGVLLSSGIE